jgi:formamidopyrimidine-DNA glycosylase
MPELPEVETIRSGIAPLVTGISVSAVVVRKHLRWPVPEDLKTDLPGHTIKKVWRRAKYLLFDTDVGTLLMHFGMSGTLRILPSTSVPQKHDHVDVQLANGQSMRFSDPRRFGAVLWFKGSPDTYHLLKRIGPEPLGKEFDGDHLYRLSRNRRIAVKQFLMNAHVVAGMGNIYTSEALFAAGIRPQRRAGNISAERYRVLAKSIRKILKAAIREGGTTLKDFVSSEGKPGYFRQELKVYGHRACEPCSKCGRSLRMTRDGQRSTFYCPGCQR